MPGMSKQAQWRREVKMRFPHLWWHEPMSSFIGPLEPHPLIQEWANKWIGKVMTHSPGRRTLRPEANRVIIGWNVHRAYPHVRFYNNLDQYYEIPVPVTILKKLPTSL